MNVIVKVNGLVYDVGDFDQIPCVGEVVTIENVDLVVSDLQHVSVLHSEGVPVLNLLPISGSARL